MMKKLLFMAMVMALPTMSRAEDIIQVVPSNTTAGVTEADEQYLSVNMANTSADIANLQFDILLPEGMRLLEEFATEEGDKIPHSVGRGGRITWKFTISYAQLSNGWYRILFTPVDLTPIEASEAGELLRLYYETDPNMAPGVYPVYIDGTNLDITVTEHIQPGKSVSYVVIGDETPLDKDAELDFSSWEGYMPSWVCESLSDDLADNTSLTSVDLTGLTGIGGKPALPGNALLYVSADTEAANALAGESNVVVTDGTTQTCEQLILTDGKPFATAKTFTASTATYQRSMNNYATLVLPYETQIPEGHKAYQVTGISDNEAVLNELSGTIPAMTPVLMETAGTDVQYVGKDVEVTHQGETSDAYMIGKLTTGEYATPGTYVLQTNVGVTSFKRVPDNITDYPLLPFRAYLVAPGNGANVLGLSFDDTSAVNSVKETDFIRVTDLNGIGRKGLEKGINIVKRADGQTVKVLVK
ncbi:MAG: hypothetical protein IKG99_07175 [Bacteroidaceae bacterium]|nr:hypothetical protein [Bacteroidaceae bacterium]